LDRLRQIQEAKIGVEDALFSHVETIERGRFNHSIAEEMKI
jgi:hypothetical protein